MNKLQEIRLLRGLSQNDLAIETQIPTGSIQAYEQGRKDINGAKLKTLLLLCNVLNCKLEDIIEDKDTIDLIRKLY